MPRYHFTTIENGTADHGHHIDLANHVSARKMASVFTGELLTELEHRIFEIDLELHVTDDDGLLLFYLTIIATNSVALATEPAGHV